MNRAWANLGDTFHGGIIDGQGDIELICSYRREGQSQKKVNKLGTSYPGGSAS
ncbi:hypothetical protein MKX01_007268, partial [Papaver californicum]